MDYGAGGEGGGCKSPDRPVSSRRASFTGEQADLDFLHQQQEDSLIPLKEDLADWLNKLLGIEIGVENFMDVLDSGVYVCKLAKLIQAQAEEAVKEGRVIEKLPRTRLRFKENARSGTWFARDNVANFIRWCRDYGVKEECLFETEGLVSHTTPRNFVLCLLELGRMAYKYGMEAPCLVAMEKEIDRLEQMSSNGDGWVSPPEPAHNDSPRGDSSRIPIRRSSSSCSVTNGSYGSSGIPRRLSFGQGMGGSGSPASSTTSSPGQARRRVSESGTMTDAERKLSSTGSQTKRPVSMGASVNTSTSTSMAVGSSSPMNGRRSTQTATTGCGNTSSVGTSATLRVRSMGTEANGHTNGSPDHVDNHTSRNGVSNGNNGSLNGTNGSLTAERASGIRSPRFSSKSPTRSISPLSDLAISPRAVSPRAVSPRPGSPRAGSPRAGSPRTGSPLNIRRTNTNSSGTMTSSVDTRVNSGSNTDETRAPTMTRRASSDMGTPRSGSIWRRSSSPHGGTRIPVPVGTSAHGTLSHGVSTTSLSGSSAGSTGGSTTPRLQRRRFSVGGDISLSDTPTNGQRSGSKTPRRRSMSTRSDKSDELDKEVRRISSRCECPQCYQIDRLSEGKYRIGDRVVFVRLLKGKHVMVRVGGGWDTLGHYLATHDPCRILEVRREPGSKHLTPDDDKFLFIHGKYKGAAASS